MAKEVVVKIPDDVYESLGWKKDLAGEILKRLAAALYAERKVSLGKAAEMSGVSYSAFLDVLAEMGITLNYDEEELEHDLETVRRLLAREGNSPF
ncbi:hypothetical protein E308F_09180 [Moorella sp. E308F]|jgi:predicted HTH domain antitoxin|nr:UPF0175 family protein [Moorella sp. E308F]GEA14676.1 hypothetical protein E308F_09180 [Moorella sp. E308F]